MKKEGKEEEEKNIFPMNNLNLNIYVIKGRYNGETFSKRKVIATEDISLCEVVDFRDLVEDTKTIPFSDYYHISLIIGILVGALKFVVYIITFVVILLRKLNHLNSRIKKVFLITSIIQLVITLILEIISLTTLIVSIKQSDNILNPFEDFAFDLISTFISILLSELSMLFAIYYLAFEKENHQNNKRQNRTVKGGFMMFFSIAFCWSVVLLGSLFLDDYRKNDYEFDTIGKVATMGTGLASFIIVWLTPALFTYISILFLFFCCIPTCCCGYNVNKYTELIKQKQNLIITSESESEHLLTN